MTLPTLRLLLALTLGFSLTAHAHGEAEHSPMHDKMEALNRDLRTLKRSLTPSAATAAASATPKEQLALADKLLAQVKELAAMKPSAKGGGPADVERLATYEKRMQPLVEKFAELRAAIAAEETNKAQEIVKALNKMKEEGHEAMGVEED